MEIILFRNDRITIGCVIDCKILIYIGMNYKPFKMKFEDNSDKKLKNIAFFFWLL